MTIRSANGPSAQGKISTPTFGFPCIAIHQLYVQELTEQPSSGPRNGILIPAWLFKKAGLISGEKVIVTRELGSQRPVSAINNRSVAPIFASEQEMVVALGSTASFLGSEGPSCCIAYGFGPVSDDVDGIDLSFGSDNRYNLERDLVQRGAMPTEPSLQRDVLYASISGLKVQGGDPYCNPTLAELPSNIFGRVNLPPRKIEAYFSSLNRSGPALKSYAVPTSTDNLLMSGALFGAFPPESEVVIDIYARISSSTAINATSVHY